MALLLRGYNSLMEAFNSNFPEDQVRGAAAIKNHEAFITIFTALDALKVFRFCVFQRDNAVLFFHPNRLQCSMKFLGE